MGFKQKVKNHWSKNEEDVQKGPTTVELHAHTFACEHGLGMKGVLEKCPQVICPTSVELLE